MSDILVVDLDSTVADTRHRHHLVPTRNEHSSWEEFAMACGDDRPIEGVVETVRMLSKMYPVYFVSGRNVAALTLTTHWLNEQGLDYESVRLNRGPDSGDPQNNVAYKVKIVEQYRAEGLNPVLVIDDWPEVCDAMEALGIPSLCPNPRYDDPPMRRGQEDNPRQDGAVRDGAVRAPEGRAAAVLWPPADLDPTTVP